MLLGAILLAGGLRYTVTVPMSIQLQIYPLETEPTPYRLHGWHPMPGTQDGVWWSYPALPSGPCEGATPTAPTPTTEEGGST